MAARSRRRNLSPAPPRALATSSATASAPTSTSISRPSCSSSSPTPSSSPSSPSTSPARSSPPARTRPTSSSPATIHLAETARFWNRFFSAALDDFNRFDGNIIGAFRHFNDIGLIEIITCGATHGYMPLLGTDESVRAQVRTAVATHIRHLGKHPQGIWAPECGYRPAGFWNYPVEFADGSPKPRRLRPHRRRAGALRIQPRLLLRRHPPRRREPPHPLPLRAPQRRSPHRRRHRADHPRRPAQPLPALLRRRPLRQALRHHRLPPRPPHRPAGLVRRHRIPRRRQLPRLPQKALARRPPLLAGHRPQRRHRRQAPLLPA